MAKNDKPAANAGTSPADAGKNGQGKPASTASTASTAGLEVISTVDGFRRAGLAWHKAPTRIALSDLTKEQIAMLKAEPTLTVREVEIPTRAEEE